ncbi:MAG: hypothetical protein AB7S36_17175 [Planctomycetota bacterium]
MSILNIIDDIQTSGFPATLGPVAVVAVLRAEPDELARHAKVRGFLRVLGKQGSDFPFEFVADKPRQRVTWQFDQFMLSSPAHEIVFECWHDSTLLASRTVPVIHIPASTTPAATSP